VIARNDRANSCHDLYTPPPPKVVVHTRLIERLNEALPGVSLHKATYPDMTVSLRALDVRLAVFIYSSSDKICDKSLSKVVATEIKKTEIAIRSVFDVGCAAWNRGDLDGYLASYWDSDQTLWVSNGSLTRGNKAIAAAYRARFSTPSQMGTLTLLELDIDVLTTEAAIAFGRWMLVIDNKSSKGFFTVQLRKIEGAWLFVSDHASTSV
jgi:uncharacterized protein (TIGR02246 family)